MSRLYYESSEVANGVRINEINDKTGTQNYLEKVSALVPAEIIAGYLTMVGIAKGIVTETASTIKNNTDTDSDGFLTNLEEITIFIIFMFCFILTPIYLNYQADENKPKRNHLILSSIAFVIWAYITSGESFLGQFYDASIGSIILVAFSLLSGFVKLNK